MNNIMLNFCSLNQLGQLTLPMEIRERMGWAEGSRLEVTVNDPIFKSITVSGFAPICSLCKVGHGTFVFQKGFICPACFKLLRA